MSDIHLEVLLDEESGCWSVSGSGLRFLARELSVRAQSGFYLVLYQIDGGYVVRSVQHLSLYQHKPGFRWVQTLVAFKDEWYVSVDSLPYRPNR